MTQTYHKRPIAPNDYYSPHQLLVYFSIDPDSLETARCNGKLLGIRGAGGFLYMGADVFAWIQAGAPTAPATQTREIATTSHTPTDRSSPVMTTSSQKPTTVRSADPIAEVERRVDDLVASQGMSKIEARKRVMKDDPDFRARYIVAFNRKHGRPQRAAEYAAQFDG